MNAVSPDTTSLTIQEGYRVVALEPAATSAALRLGLVWKENPDPIGGMLISLGETADASIYLGCVTDAAGQIREWLEVWVQNLENLEKRFPSHIPIFSNQVLDQQWADRAERWRAADPESFIVTGWEREHPLPLYLSFSLNANTTVHPGDTPGEPWRLATDDAALAAAGLPPFSASLVRYLTTGGATPRFIPLTNGAPENEHTTDAKSALRNLVPVNPAGGLLMVRRLAALELGEWMHILSGGAWRGIEHGRKPFRLRGIYRTLQNEDAIRQGSGHFLLAPQGRPGRMLEAFHLKLQTLRAALVLVRDWVAREQRPFLNLRAESFRVQLGETDGQLPYLWNSETTLAIPGEAIALPVESTELRCFAPPNTGDASIYQPRASRPVRGGGILRVREVTTTGDKDICVVEGTLTTQERLDIAVSDLLCVHFALPSGRVSLYGRWDASEELSSNELRFRTLPRVLPPTVLMALRETGVTIPHVTFETYPILNTACDLYSLGVIAVQALLASGGGGLTLPKAMDELLSLAALVAEKGADATQTVDTIRAIVAENDKWQAN
ncbi:MAG TPA: hypothetical protein VK968_05630, partial [Roseimicrobium sp.]|nr:hypothetical protein [Roseimicrobium sp.]